MLLLATISGLQRWATGQVALHTPLAVVGLASHQRGAATYYRISTGIGALPEKSILISLHSGEQHVIRMQNRVPFLDTAASERLTVGIRKNIEETDVTMEEAMARKAPRMAGFTLAPSMIGDRGSTLFAMVME